MHVRSFFLISALVTLLAQAAPVPEVEARALFKSSKAPKPPAVSLPKPPVAPAPPPRPPVAPPSPPPPPPAPAPPKPPVALPPPPPPSPPPKPSVVPPPAPDPKPSVAPPPPPARTSVAPPLVNAPPPPAKQTAVAPPVTVSKPPPATSSPTVTTSSLIQTTTSASSTTSAASATNTTAAADNSTDILSCPLYTQADAVDLAARQLALEKRARGAREEFWFRFDDPTLANSGDILQLAPHDKDFDDQAYKWISTDAGKVVRSRVPGRAGVLYVLPAGTRASILGAAKKFEETSVAKQAADFVTKDNEPNDVGINGVATSADGTIPLDVFRNKVIRAVVKKVSAKAKGKATFVTITKGKRSNTASKTDQDALAFVCG